MRNEDTIDPLKLYFNELRNYPLLSSDEEVMHGKNLKLFDEISILERIPLNSDLMEVLDLNKILLSCNNDNYKEVITSLMTFFKNKEEYKDKYKKLKKYKLKSEEVNRALNSSEVKDIFGIDDEVECLSTKELLEEVKKYIIYQNSFDIMYRSNLRLVVTISRDYLNSSFDWLELINEGNLGLRRAIQKYDVDKNCKFSTYAAYWIRSVVNKFTYEQSDSLEKPFYKKNIIANFKKEVSNLEQVLGHTPSIYEITENLGLSIEKVEEYITFGNETFSLDKYIDDSITISDLIPSSVNVENEVINIIGKEHLMELLNTVNEKRRKVLELRFGFYDEEKTLDEIGNVLGISKQRVKMLEDDALIRLRENSKKINWNF